MSNHNLWPTAAAALAAVLLAQSTVFAQPFACGDVVSTDATLTTDLDCTGFAEALTLRGKVHLNLAGFSVTSAPIGCDDKCSVEGPGMVDSVRGTINAETDPLSIAVIAATVNGLVGYAKNTIVNDSSVNGNVAGKIVEMTTSVVNNTAASVYGAAIYGEKVTLTDVLVSNAVANGVTCARCLIRESTISGSADNGVFCEIRVENSSAEAGWLAIYDSVISGNGTSGNGGGIWCARKARIERTTIADNGVHAVYVNSAQDFGDQGYRLYGAVTLTDSTVSGNGAGVDTLRVLVRRSSITNNENNGIMARRVKLDAATVVDNAPKDIESEFKPRLVNGATCGTSEVADVFGEQSWGVCALD